MLNYLLYIPDSAVVELVRVVTWRAVVEEGVDTSGVVVLIWTGRLLFVVVSDVVVICSTEVLAAVVVELTLGPLVVELMVKLIPVV